MCGIVGYYGPRNPKDVIMAGLKSLEYRGYDSAGVAILHHGDFKRVRAEGKLAALETKLLNEEFDGHLGIGPESTQPGDQIVVLDGARSPFVLRNLEDSTDYALLGDSFVLGLMHGEVREMDARGQLESRQTVIR